ncbi:MAG: hypothetical protein IPN64_11005 [Propionivibrio sp.]|uniref:hypothetical protein n=1 Tax=Propionivibrio sp. TaxID=2212460 RepID=UPI0025D823DC|nr:hypothetical protein [Propionivibrio sp.]MBK8894545.1 hypothetical protein [Propionivibrio sp.]
MEIPNNLNTKKGTVVLVAALCGFVYVTSLALEVAQTSSGIQSVLTWGFAIAMAAFALRFFALLFEKSSIHLVASKPPLLVTKKTWFGKFTAKKQLEIMGGAWVRARREVMDSDSLVVEVGTNGYQTTTIKCYPYSERNIPIATTLCSEIAEFLVLEDKGYKNYA